MPGIPPGLVVGAHETQRDRLPASVEAALNISTAVGAVTLAWQRLPLRRSGDVGVLDARPELRRYGCCFGLEAR